MKNNFEKTTIDHFAKEGYLVLSYPKDLRRAVERAVESWKEFVSLPVSVKKGLPYSNGGAGVGYELKDGVGPKADRKENFDVTLSGVKWLENNINTINNPLALKFVKDATSLIPIMKPVILDFAQRIEDAFGVTCFVDEVKKSEGAFFTRFIHYFPDRQIGDEIATAHTDQSGFTFHLYESDPGFQGLTYGSRFARAFSKLFSSGRKWIDIPISEGKTVIIPSMQMQLISVKIGNKILYPFRAFCHRVIATKETAIHGRFSAVCFIQLNNTPKYDKDRCGRLQEKTPGFNYDMATEEFAKMFK